VVSLLGGIVAVHQTNPIDYTCRLANQLGAECYMFLAPLLVDSIETKRNLIEKCGPISPQLTIARSRFSARRSWCGPSRRRWYSRRGWLR
ncbi:hypothetical protein AB9F39_36175, partial [Rhizobium leguminosarum]